MARAKPTKAKATTKKKKKAYKDYDSPWKMIIENSLYQFLLFFYPKIHKKIDWSRTPIFLDKELNRCFYDSKVTIGQEADILVKVWLKNGDEIHIFLHVEVQGKPEADFEHRLYIYNYRIHDHQNGTVITLALLTDTDPSWRPTKYQSKALGFELTMKFPMAKLTDFTWEYLEQSDNPYALVVMIHRKAQQTRKDPASQVYWKSVLLEKMIERNYSEEMMTLLIMFLDWLLNLPKHEEELFWENVKEIGKERNMTHLLSIERLKKDEWLAEGIEKGIVKGRVEGRVEEILSGIELGLELKFGDRGLALLPTIATIHNLDTLTSIRNAIRTAQTLDDIRAVYQSGNPERSI